LSKSRRKNFHNVRRNKSNDRPAVQAPDLELYSGIKVEGAHTFKGFDTPVRVHLHHVRRRLADSDGISGKAALDAIVNAGVLADDNVDCVVSVTHSQEQTHGPEKTIITLEVVHEES